MPKTKGAPEPIEALLKHLTIEKRYTNHIGRKFAAVVHKVDGRRVDIILRDGPGFAENYGSAREIKIAAARKFLDQERRNAAAENADDFAGL